MKNVSLFFLPKEGFLEKRMVFGAENFGEQEPTMPPASQRLAELRKQMPTQPPTEPTRPGESPTEPVKEMPTQPPTEPTRPE